MDKIRSFLKENYLIVILLGVLLILHILVVRELGFDYTLKSDDASYIQSGITFLEEGKITMHGVLSAQIMPGMTFLIALFALVFGKGFALMVALKIFWMLMGLLTVFVVYKIIRLFTNQYIAVIPCLFFLSMDYIWMNNTILTETPFLLLFALLIYHSFKLADTHAWKDYIFIVVYYMLAVMLRPNIGIFPIFLALYLLFKKYDFKLLLKQGLIAGGVLLLLLVPWTIRNYKIFNKFIPLTYGVGNPLLLGTYQGYYFPHDEELDYDANIIMSDDMKYYLDNPLEKDYMTKYYSLEYDGLKAKYRMREWWNKNPKYMLHAYLYYKPLLLLTNGFYWKEVLGVSESLLYAIRKVEIVIFGLCSLVVLIDRKKVKEWFFLMFVYGSQIAIYAYTFAYGRYAITMFFLRYIVIGIGLQIIYDYVKKKRKRI